MRNHRSSHHPQAPLPPQAPPSPDNPARFLPSSAPLSFPATGLAAQLDNERGKAASFLKLNPEYAGLPHDVLLQFADGAARAVDRYGEPYYDPSIAEHALDSDDERADAPMWSDDV